MVLGEHRGGALERSPAGAAVELATPKGPSVAEVHHQEVGPVSGGDPADRGSEPTGRPIARGRQQGRERDVSST
jgi:hypothetical protein